MGLVECTVQRCSILEICMERRFVDRYWSFPDICHWIIFLVGLLGLLWFPDPLRGPRRSPLRWLWSGGWQLRAANVNVNFGDDINDSVISVISVISVWHVGIMLIQPGECRNTISQWYVWRLRRWKDNVNVIFRNDISDSATSAISVISVCHVGSMLIQPGECRNTIL